MHIVSAIISMLGGLAMFLYGIEVMGDGLKNSSGEALKRVLEKVTGNVILGVLTGALVTAVIQSSTATIVLAVALITLVPNPVVNLIGCAICGFSIAIMWPGTLSKASATLRTGGTMMFAMLALAGDIGCSAGPTLVGLVSDGFGGNMKAGILAGILFPAVLLLCILLWKKPMLQ